MIDFWKAVVSNQNDGVSLSDGFIDDFLLALGYTC